MEHKSQSSFHFSNSQHLATSLTYTNQPNQSTYLRNTSPRTTTQSTKNNSKTHSYLSNPAVVHHNSNSQGKKISNQNLNLNSNSSSNHGLPSKHSNAHNLIINSANTPQTVKSNQRGNLQSGHNAHNEFEISPKNSSKPKNNSANRINEHANHQHTVHHHLSQQQVTIQSQKVQKVQYTEIQRANKWKIPQEDSFILETTCDLENQRVVKADADRTRASESLNKDHLELILTLYCKRNNIKYKQGLNEVLAPFLYLQQNSGFELNFTYNSFSTFIWRYMTTFYQDEEFYSLQAALAFLTLLFKYHDPELCIYLENNQVTPEMYAIPWFLTYFANLSQKVNHLIFLQQYQESLSVLQKNQNKFGQGKIIISSFRAQQLQDNTPYSFKELADIKMIFQIEFQQQPKEQLLSYLEKIENMPCLPIMPEELFFYSYPEVVSCSNPQCQNSLNGYKILNASTISGLQSPQMSTQFSIQSQQQQQQQQTKARRQSMNGFDDNDILSPVREASMKLPAQDDSYQVVYSQQQRRLTTIETFNKTKTHLQQPTKKANIHDIIKKEINQKNQNA